MSKPVGHVGVEEVWVEFVGSFTESSEESPSCFFVKRMGNKVFA